MSVRSVKSTLQANNTKEMRCRKHEMKLQMKILKCFIAFAVNFAYGGFSDEQIVQHFYETETYL